MKTYSRAEIRKLEEILNAGAMIAVYGKQLAKSQAAIQLEKYIISNRFCTLFCAPAKRATLFDTVEANRIEGAPFPFLVSNLALSIFRNAMADLDAKFFADFAHAIERRKDPAYADRFKVTDFINGQYQDLVSQKRGRIENDELRALGIKNVSRTVSELGLEAFIGTHTDRRGKPKKKNTK